MDAEVSYSLKYGCLGYGSPTPRLMVVSSQTRSVLRWSAAFLFLTCTVPVVRGIIIRIGCAATSLFKALHRFTNLLVLLKLQVILAAQVMKLSVSPNVGGQTTTT